MSLRALGEACGGRSGSFVDKVERGQKKVPPEMLYQLAAAFRVPLSNMFHDPDNLPPEEEVALARFRRENPDEAK